MKITFKCNIIHNAKQNSLWKLQTNSKQTSYELNCKMVTQKIWQISWRLFKSILICVKHCFLTNKVNLMLTSRARTFQKVAFSNWVGLNFPNIYCVFNSRVILRIRRNLFIIFQRKLFRFQTYMYKSLKATIQKMSICDQAVCMITLFEVFS